MESDSITCIFYTSEFLLSSQMMNIILSIFMHILLCFDNACLITDMTYSL